MGVTTKDKKERNVTKTLGRPPKVVRHLDKIRTKAWIAACMKILEIKSATALSESTIYYIEKGDGTGELDVRYGVQKRMCQHYRNGTKIPKDETVDKLCKACGKKNKEGEK